MRYGKRGAIERGNSRPARRRGLVAAGVTSAAVAGTWAAIHLVPGFGPALADGVRALVGPGPVAWAEDVVYGIEDRVKGIVYRNAPPKTFWEPAPPEATPHLPAQDPIASNAPVAPAFAPAAFAPPFPRVATAGDGEWIPIVDPSAPDAPPRMMKTSVHPDPKRGYAAVAVVAIDLERTSLHLVAGSIEPASAAVPPSARPGVVPTDQFGDLVAAFNGGFKAEHGHYGMMLDGRTFLPPREISCTVALYKDGGIRIRTWPALSESAADMVGFRQTPPCLVEDGNVNDTLAAREDARGWGAAVDGGTAIRRSALGLDRAGKTLFYGLGESVTAGTLARAMKAAGAVNAAQLDVNASYPRFVFFGKPRPNERPTVTHAIIPDIAFSRHEYVGRPEGRDFFYLLRKSS
jgi:hypothetical protein